MTEAEKDEKKILKEECMENESECCEAKAEAAAESDKTEKSEAENQENKEPERNLEEELKEANDKYLRLSAEYQNFRKRTESEKLSIAAYSNEKIAKELLNVVDSFERALSADNTADESFKNGVELIYKQLIKVLSNFGVEPIETEGKEFDPNFHHAVLSEEAEGVEEGMILMEMQKGYTLKERVIRPAMVKVSV